MAKTDVEKIVFITIEVLEIDFHLATEKGFYNLCVFLL